MLVDAARRQPVSRLGRQQQVVDPDAPVLLPGAGLIVPEGVEPCRVGGRPYGFGQAEIEECAELGARLRQE